MDPLQNPFRPGAGSPPPELVGRDSLLNEFEIAAKMAIKGKPGQSLMPVGLRGVGKTVLLNRFQEIAQSEGFKTGFIEIPEGSQFMQHLAIRLRSILLSLDQGPIEASVKRALGVLKAFTIHLPGEVSINLDIDAIAGSADSGLIDEDLTDLLVACGEAAAQKGVGIFIAVDELQYLDETDFGALISAVHRTSQLDLPVIVAGAGLPQLPALAGNAKSYAERLFKFPRIDSLSRRDADSVLSIPAERQGVEFSKEALDRMFEVTHGYPYFLQVWGHEVWNSASTSPISADDVEAIAPYVIASLDENFFRVRFDRMTPSERAYLRAMAEIGPGPHRSGDIATALNVKVESVAPRRSALIKKGMIYSPAHGDTAFTVPMFDEFLKRAMPES